MKLLGRVLILFWVLMLCVSANAFASPIQWTTGTNANGHWYEVFTFSTAISWTEAKNAAQGQSWQGIQGNLASITSAEENEFVAGLFEATDWVYNNKNGFMGPWIGGYQPNNSAWNWIDGETWGFAAWESNQPSDQTDQDYVHYYVYLASTGDPLGETPTWNDYADIQGTVYGYVVEYSPTPVPEPASIILLGSGIAGLAGMRKKRMMKKKNRG